MDDTAQDREAAEAQVRKEIILLEKQIKEIRRAGLVPSSLLSLLTSGGKIAPPAHLRVLL
jgi:hypothetical protein